MRKPALTLFAAALLLTVASVSVPAGETTTLTGEYRWNWRDNTGDLEAVFVPAGDDRWDVSFYFTFRGEDHVYSGSAEGSLTDGPLRGKVFNDSRERTFVFDGIVDRGVFEGTHAETTGGEAEDTGTLTLRR